MGVEKGTESYEARENEMLVCGMEGRWKDQGWGSRSSQQLTRRVFNQTREEREKTSPSSTFLFQLVFYRLRKDFGPSNAKRQCQRMLRSISRWLETNSRASSRQ
ncbi:uncharacterized protein TrAFT101_001795 [Trichoderma asperellum]|uniref:uncharacterized protein n=1 Tax=Trichoderma asperellum TaxID=101201 RepID=UPI00331CF83A|nr:hypothetical protein TrAFT101_001795 [Trichoderma asperellum]